MSLLSEDHIPFRLPPVGIPEETDLFSFEGSVGPNGENRREDVIKAQTLLQQTGDFDPEKIFKVPTGWPSGDLWRGIKAFQKRHGKQPDGTLLPVPVGGVDENGVGESVEALRGELGHHFAGQKARTPGQVDAHYENEARVRNTVADEAASISTQPQPTVMSDVPDAAPPQAKAGQQEAFAPAAIPIVVGAARAAPAIVNLLRGAAGALTGATAVSVSGDTPAPEKPTPDHDQARTADPAQPEEDKVERDNPPQRGRIVIAPDGKELNVPPLESWADGLDGGERKLAEDINEALAVEMAHHFGGRGNPLTQRGINIVIQECLDAARKEFPDSEVSHVFGGRQDGEFDKEKLKEEHLWHYDEEGNPVRQGSRRPDWGIKIARNIAEMVRGNTFDSKKDGEPSQREDEAKKGIKDKIEDEVLVMVAKDKGQMTEGQFRADANKVCTDTMRELRMDWTKRGEFAKPAPKAPGDYAGPASARKAAERRRLLGK